jgi:SAM-dependent methyltransferase
MSEPLSKSEIATRYGEIPVERFMPVKFHRRCVKLMRPHLRAGAAVIDLGCGHGTLLAVLLRFRKLELHGCDLSPKLWKARVAACGARIVEADLKTSSSLPQTLMRVRNGSAGTFARRAKAVEIHRAQAGRLAARYPAQS